MLELPSTISAVTVYRQGALVERRVELPAQCEGTLKISALPLILQDHTLSVRVEGPEPRPVVVDFQVGLQVNGATETSDLEQELEQARHRCEALRARLASLLGLLAGLQALQPGGRPHSADGAPLGSYQIEGQMELLAFREDETRRLEDERAGLETELKDAGEALARLQYQCDSRAPAVRPEALEKAVRLTLQGETPEGTTLYLSYGVPGARWAPAYSVSFSSSLDKAELTMRAMLAQRTGEDWKDVTLTLSTADPSEWREIPEWKALRIGRAEEPGEARWFPPPSGAEALFADFDAARSRRRSETIITAPAPPPPPPMEPAPVLMADPLLGALAHDFDQARLAVGGAAGGAPTSPPPMMMPAPAAAPKSGSLFSLASAFGGASGRADLDDSTEGGGGSRFQTTQTVDRRYMRYQNLRLVDCTDHGRGQLLALEEFEHYLESKTTGWSLDDMVSALAMAESRADQVTRLTAPPGYTYPQQQSGFDYAYQAQAPVDATSDGIFHSVPVFVCELSPSLNYVCTPRESPLVFRTAEMINPSGRALPEGPADISVGGDFLHTTPLRGVTPDGKLSLGLGVEQSIKVSRNTVFKEGTSGLMGGTAELTHTVTVEVVNHRSYDIVLEIRERLPQPAPEHKDEMKVLLGQVKPPWEGFEPEKNPLLKTAYRWKLPIASGEKAVASATYIVEMPSKYEIQGGNRREPRT